MVGQIQPQKQHLNGSAVAPAAPEPAPAVSSSSVQGPPTATATTTTTDEVQQLRARYEKADQAHVFAFYDDLSAADKTALFDQLKSFDPDRINVLADRALHPPSDNEAASPPSVEPLPAAASASILDSDKQQVAEWYNAGLGLIAGNKVAVVLMAGGQGTRLGSTAPKGCFDIGLPSKKSLFELQAERIVKIQTLAQQHTGQATTPVVPWYVMTSGPTREATEQFFQQHGFFGLSKQNVIFFEQGVLPCISNEGKILMESKSRVAVAPDGNGGIYNALVASGALADLRKRGVEHIHAYCVDNCLAKVADPVFIGFAASKDLDIATKVVRKRAANEPVGLIIQKDGKPGVIEYSEIDKRLAEATDADGRLKFRAANIVNHYYSSRFLDTIDRWAQDLPHHVAKKKIPFFDPAAAATVKPDKPNGIKLEQFVFDVFPLVGLDKFASFEVDRKEEFSPLKNARGAGEDDPDTSRRDVTEQGARWLRSVGAILNGDSVGVEISPLKSYGGEGLEAYKGQEITAPSDTNIVYIKP